MCRILAHAISAIRYVCMYSVYVWVYFKFINSIFNTLHLLHIIIDTRIAFRLFVNQIFPFPDGSVTEVFASVCNINRNAFYSNEVGSIGFTIHVFNRIFFNSQTGRHSLTDRRNPKD